MDTSKTRSIKSLLIQAWRERWTDVSWGIHIKSVLPRGVSGDVYDLANCILQQALIGPGPNNLFMTYLKHCLSSHVVSYGAVLSSIGRYQCFYKPYCILSLLKLLESFLSRIGCRGNEEECIELCKAVVSVTLWLYSCVYHSLAKLNESKTTEHISIVEKSYEALSYFNKSTFIKSLLYVGKFEDHVTFTHVFQRHKELEEKVYQLPNVTNISKEVVESALNLLGSVDSLPIISSEHTSKNIKKLHIEGSTINTMVVIDAILSPANDITTFVNHLLLIKKLENFSLSQLYCEIIRSCLIGIVDNFGHFDDDLKWYAFTFLKLPNLILRIHNTQTDNEENAFEKGLDTLLQFTPLLDQMDLRSNCDSLQYLVNEFINVKMLTESQGIKLVSRRQAETCKIQKSNPSKLNPERSQASVTLVLRAEHTLKSILISFDSDYLKNQEPLLRFLCQILPTKNFKLILAAFSATGKINTFITKLIEYNDYNKFVNCETVKASQTRTLMFDVTFLLLFYITQYYGIEVIISNAQRKDSFFVNWITECLSEDGKFKSPDLALKRSDQETTDALLAQFLNTGEEIKTHQVEWDKICWNAPAAAKEILIAWEHEIISTEKVKIILDYIKGQFCFLPMVISAWLCNYINILHHQERLKPMNMLQQFMTPLSESATSLGESPSSSGHHTPQIPSSELEKSFYSERSGLMVGIINKMVLDLHPPKQTNYKVAPLVTHGLTVEMPLGKILDEVYRNVHLHGWLDLGSIRYFNTLLCVGGAHWLCDSLVRKIFSFNFLKDINRAVDIIVGIFYLDIEKCALELLHHILPSYLNSEICQNHLAEPYGTAFARLSVITAFAALQSKQSVAMIKTGSKRKHYETGIDDSRDQTELSRPSKIQRCHDEFLEDTPFQYQSLSEEHLRSAVSNPINKAILNLMRTLLAIATDATISARSYFPLIFLEQVVSCAKDQASDILQFMPLGLVGLLLKKYPEEFSHELILAVSSMLSPKTRKASALNLCQLTILLDRLTKNSQISIDF